MKTLAHWFFAWHLTPQACAPVRLARYAEHHIQAGSPAVRTYREWFASRR
ncbi:MAG TPA: hypothetical protein VF607_10105 [Verrucomicrobiae bacterium]